MDNQVTLSFAVPLIQLEPCRCLMLYIDKLSVHLWVYITYTINRINCIFIWFRIEDGKPFEIGPPSSHNIRISISRDYPCSQKSLKDWEIISERIFGKVIIPYLKPSIKVSDVCLPTDILGAGSICVSLLNTMQYPFSVSLNFQPCWQFCWWYIQ